MSIVSAKNSNLIISLNGHEGSGKSTIARMVAERLGVPMFHMGQIFRDKAAEKGMTLAEYGRLRDTSPAYDREADDHLLKLAAENDSFVIDSRTAWHFIPQSLKIFLKVDISAAAERIMKELQADEARKMEDKNLDSIKNIISSIKKRRSEDNKKYLAYYGINPDDEINYDLVLDTTNLSITDVFEKVMEFIGHSQG